MDVPWDSSINSHNLILLANFVLTPIFYKPLTFLIESIFDLALKFCTLYIG